MTKVAPDRIIHNARICTMSAANRPGGSSSFSAVDAEAMAILDGKVIAIGNSTDILGLAGTSTRMENMHGRAVMPGLIESHTHALWGACRELFDVFVGYQATFDQLMDAVRERVNRHAPDEAISGGPWRLDMRRQMGSNPREVLDAISTEHLIILKDATEHSVWCNTAALKKAGLFEKDLHIPGGVVEKDAVTGIPNGILAEAAGGPVVALASRTEVQLAEAARYFCRYFNKMGITGFKEPMAYEAELAAYKAADQRGALTLHAATHLTKSSPLSTSGVSWETLEGWRTRYQSENVHTGFAKLFLDGVAPSLTASFVEPYLASSGYDVAGHDPLDTLLIAPDELADMVSELDRRGFVVKMHAVGDNAVRVGLDAIEAARSRNGNSGLRHELAHCPFVRDEDLPRFAKLGAVAEVSPKLWFPNAVTAGQQAVLGEDRTERCHRIRDLLEAGAELVYGSDWPAAAPDADPWTGMSGMLTRTHPKGLFPGSLGVGQAITLDQALPLFTVNGARAMGLEDQTGSLAIGKWADYIVLDKPLAEMTPEEIANLGVLETVWKGHTVHQV